MSIKLPQVYTYNEYLQNPPQTDFLYELINGKIVKMPPESYRNVCIALKLLQILANVFGIECISNKAEIITAGAKVTSRYPDLLVFNAEGLAEIKEKNTSTIDLDMIPPLLVIEVVSPGKEAADRDYRYKRSEYAARGIQYYWIFDPQFKVATFLELIDGIYETVVQKQTGILTLENFYNLEINLDDFWN